MRNNRRRRILRALVSGDLEGEPLIGWLQMQEWGLLSRSFPNIVDEESEEEDEEKLGDFVGDSAKAVRSNSTTVDTEEVDLGIKGKIERLKKQMEDQRNCQDFLNLEERLKTEYSDIFHDELQPGVTMTMPPQKLVMREGVEVKPAKVCKAVPVPIHQVEASEVDMAKLLQTGVIRKVIELTIWTSPARFVTKPSGALRIVTDFRQLNTYQERPTHPFLTTEVRPR